MSEIHKATEGKYLQDLKFDPELNKSSFAFWTDRMRAVILILLLVIIGGVASLNMLPLESQPEVTLGIGVASTVLPGASPSTVEDLVTKKLEKEIGKIKGINKMTSNSMNGVSSIVVEFKPEENITEAIRNLKDRVDFAKKDLPADAKEPVVQEISFSDTPFWTFTMGGKYDGFTMRRFAESIKDDFEKMDQISEVRISGGDEEEFHVYYNPTKLEAYGITADQADNAIKASNLAFPIGETKIDKYKHIITVDNRYYTAAELSDIVVMKNGETGIIRVKDIASVELGAKKRTRVARVAVEGKPAQEAITLSVIKKSGGSIVNLYDEGLVRLDALKNSGTLPSDITIKTTYSMADRIRADIDGLIKDFLVTIALVLAVLFLFLGFRLSIVPTLTIPVVFLITFVFMQFFGLTLNFLSLFALVLSLGLLVDDAILIVEAFHKYSATGRFSYREAMLLVLRDYKWVDTSTTLVIACFFASMMFMTGIIGRFMFSFPFVITITLLASLIGSLTVVPALTLAFQKGKHPKDRHPELISGSPESQGDAEMNSAGRVSWLSRLMDAKPLLSLNPLIAKYEKGLTWVLETKKRRRLILVVIFALFFAAASLPATGLLKSEFFPATNEDLLTIDIESQPGQQMEITSKITEQVEAVLKDEKEIDSFTTTVGSLSSLGNKSLGGSSSGDHYGNITINLVKKDNGRVETSQSIADRLRGKVAKIIIPGTTLTVGEMKGGPPAGADLEVRIAGKDFTVINKIAKDLKPIIQSLPGAVNVSTSKKPVPLEFNLSFDSAKLALYNISLPQVATFIRTALEGNETTKIYRGSDEIVVKTRYEETSVDTLDKIKSLKIKNNKGNYVFLGDLMKNTLKPSVDTITRIDQKRVIAVQAGANSTTNGTQLLADFNAAIKAKNFKLPPGYEFIIGGENEESAKSIQSLMVSMLFGLLGVIIIMILQFDSYKEAAISLIPIPLALIGVFFGLTLTGQTLSFPSLIGFVALFGMVSNHSIYLIDKINLNIKAGVQFDDAIKDSCITRFEPVALTSMTTIMGFLPLAFTDSFWASLAQSLVFGLLTAGILKMFVVPILYKGWIKPEERTHLQ